MSFKVSYGCWLSLTVSSSSMELLYCLSQSPIVDGCLSQYCYMSLSLLWLLAVSHCLSQFHGVYACHLLSHIYWVSLSVSPSPMKLLHVFHCLLCLLTVFLSHGGMSLTVSYSCLLSLIPFPIQWSCYNTLTVSFIFMELLHVSNWLLAVSFICVELLHVSYWLLAVSFNAMEFLAISVSLVSWSFYISQTISLCCWLSLTVSPCSMKFQYVSHCLL